MSLHTSRKSLAILGSTGSVGCSTLDVVKLHPEKYQVVALTACHNVDKMYEQCLEFSPAMAVMADNDAALALEAKLKQSSCKTEVLAGHESIVSLAKDDQIDSVMVAIVGGIGLEPSFAAVQAGKTVMIANKEPLVMAGSFFMAEARKSGANILPIDSEHNALFQCLPFPFAKKDQIESLILTASGGPFLGKKWQDLKAVSLEQAIAHPNWSMGPKISVDSATMMNKGLELIEATHLFEMPAKSIDILIHPQSVIHSMVEYIDGSHLAQLGTPDMRVPIAHALSFPDRISSGVDKLDLTTLSSLEFQKPDWNETPCLRLAKEVATSDAVDAIKMNAANEIAVDAFINKRISFTDIYTIIDKVVNQSFSGNTEMISDILQLDQKARVEAKSVVELLS